MILPLFARAGTLDDAKEAYLYGDYSEALDLALGAVAEDSNDEALYFAGLAYFKLGRYSDARLYFKSLLHDFEDSKHHDAAMIKLVDTYFLEEDYGKAEDLYKSIINRFPRFEYLPLVYLRLGQVAAKKGIWEDKRRYLTVVTSDFPRSQEAGVAARLKRRGDFFTIQVGAFSKRQNAQELLRKLKGNYTVYIIDENDNDVTLYKVRVGKYKTRAEAEEVSSGLKDAGFQARIYP